MNRQSILQYVDKKFKKNTPPDFHVGDTVRVQVRIKEGNNTRLQAFEGVVIAFKGLGGARSFTVRKISFTVGVERTFPLTSPLVEKVQIIRSGKVRRAKLYYLRDRAGKSARLEEKDETKTKATTNSKTPKEVVEEVTAAPATPLVGAKEK